MNEPIDTRSAITGWVGCVPFRDVGLDALGYCIDAPDWIPTGSHEFQASDVSELTFVFGETFRDGLYE